MNGNESDPTQLDGMIEGLEGSSDFDWGAPDLEEDSGEVLDVVRFTLAGTPMVVEGRFVREILGEVEVTRLPGAPEHIEGIGVLKRQVVGILDLAKWLGIDVQHARKEVRLMVLEHNGMTAGVFVDSVDGIETWPEAIDASTVPETFGDRVRTYARGSRWAPGGVVLLLDVARILDDAAVR